MSRGERPAAAPSALASLVAMDGMRTLRTDAEREETASLVQDRQRWLTMRGLPAPARADIPALPESFSAVSALSTGPTSVEQ
ncbi:hypothetical protein ACE1SV_49170 [Streptomyces sp. E-15]